MDVTDRFKEISSQKLYPSEIHLLLLIDAQSQLNATGLAERLGLTKGAVSQTLTRLEKKGVLIVQESAIIYNRERKTFVELYDPSAENLSRRMPIEIGISNGTATEVTSGLSEGDRLVLPERGLI